MRRRLSADMAIPALIAVLLATSTWSHPAYADSGDVPRMDPKLPIYCVTDDSGKPWRIQCDENSKRCLYAPDGEIARTGDEPGDFQITKPLERARQCVDPPRSGSPQALQAQGYKLVRAVADAPYGWTRDLYGRVFQVNFDLKRRFYVGAAYAPAWRRSASQGAATQGVAAETRRMAIEAGLLSFERFRDRTRHRVRLAEGQVFLAPFAGSGVLAHYDVSRRFQTPLVRITTFVGQPRRHDLYVNVGLWAEAGGMEFSSTPAGSEQLARYLTLHGTIDLWQSADLYSYARVRGGVGFEGARTDNGDLHDHDDRNAITPGGAIEADLTLDSLGFHHIIAALTYENPRYYNPHPILGNVSHRIKARAEYEVIILAINDQPLSLRVAVAAEKRDDIPSLPSAWALRADAGLRFSLWAPPRSP